PHPAPEGPGRRVHQLPERLPSGRDRGQPRGLRLPGPPVRAGTGGYRRARPGERTIPGADAAGGARGAGRRGLHHLHRDTRLRGRGPRHGHRTGDHRGTAESTGEPAGPPRGLFQRDAAGRHQPARRLGLLLSTAHPHPARHSPTTASSAVVTSHQLRVAYGAAPVLTDVSLRIDRGEAVALLGANGSGKSTLMRTLLGITPASSGQVELFGVPLRNHGRVPWERIGYVPQRAHATSGIPATALEVVLTGMLNRRTQPMRS